MWQGFELCCDSDGAPVSPRGGRMITFGEDRYPLWAGKGDEAIFWEVALVAVRVRTSPGAVCGRDSG